MTITMLLVNTLEAAAAGLSGRRFTNSFWPFALTKAPGAVAGLRTMSNPGARASRLFWPALFIDRIRPDSCGTRHGG